MPPYQGKLSDDDIADVAAYVEMSRAGLAAMSRQGQDFVHALEHSSSSNANCIWLPSIDAVVGLARDNGFTTSESVFRMTPAATRSRAGLPTAGFPELPLAVNQSFGLLTVAGRHRPSIRH